MPRKNIGEGQWSQDRFQSPSSRAAKGGGWICAPGMRFETLRDAPFSLVLVCCG
jgi:hypothetical protein